MIFEVKLEYGFWSRLRQFHFDFYCFFDFLDRIFFLNGFPNPFIVRSRPSFLFEPNFDFSVVVFCSHAAISLWFLLFFDFLDRIFFSKWFFQSIHSSFYAKFFVWTKFRFLGSGFFCSHAAFKHWCFFSFFWSCFFRNSFYNSLIVRSMFSCLFSQLNFFELYVRNCLAMFFLKCVHTFSWFLKSNWSGGFGHAETGSGVKKRVVLRREFFSL